MIYQGKSDNTTGTGTQLQTSAFNNSDDNNMYVGYMYGSGVHGLSSSSTIKGILDNWYRDNLATNYGDKIDGNAGFCGDRTVSSTGTTATNYAAYNRLISNKQPSFECTNDSDLYTTSGSEDGNKALMYPIGLITADEVTYAGGVYTTNNTSYYLYTGQQYWTMSPCNVNSGGWVYVFVVASNGSLGANVVNYTSGVRPVINLKANVTISAGNGSAENPFEIS